MMVSVEAQLYLIKLKSLSSLPDTEGSGCAHLFFFSRGAIMSG